MGVLGGTGQGFATKIGSWGYSKKSDCPVKVANKVLAIKESLSDRLRHTQIEQTDAHKVIASRDTPETFVYADPPYIGSNQGNYGGYTEMHFQRDLDELAALKGKFLLSSYPSSLLDEYVKTHGWWMREIDKPLSASSVKNNSRKRKIEVLVGNYPID